MAVKTKSYLFRSYRALQGLSQQDIAQAIGEHGYYVSLVETGRAIPPLATAKKICRLLRAPMEELFPELSGDSRPPVKGRTLKSM